ncbi:(S)-ureidoglycine aminohydrolase [Paracoccus sp. (in: a-proteobacteria)]|uniref:(S)-ureidoglycine aminohydrolase n=1 Tax=Paracoccus sp. TaxID=267 RepID=UPI00321FFA94
MTSYFTPNGNVPPQTTMITSKAVVREAYVIIPASSMTDNVRSILPDWRNTRCWVLAAPAIGFATAFAEYLVFLDQGGGCDRPEVEAGGESFLFVLDGELTITVDGRTETYDGGGFAFVPPDTPWAVRNDASNPAKFLWIRKAFEPLGDLRPAPILRHERDVPIVRNPTSDQKWTHNLIPTNDIAYDMHMNMVSFGPGATISAIETHIMEHGLYMLQGKGMYLFNEQWHEVEAGDFIWMRAFCPQAFYAGGPGPARYLLYKNMNRQIKLRS